MESHAWEIPDPFKSDIDKAVSILLAEGSRAVYLFGSLKDGSWTPESDIDLAVTGIAANRFFEIYSKAGRGLMHELDLINLDTEKRFAKFLKDTNRLVQIA